MVVNSSIPNIMINRDKFEIDLIIAIHDILKNPLNKDCNILIDLNLIIPEELVIRIENNPSKIDAILSYKKENPQTYYRFIKRIFNKLLYANLNMFENSIQTGDVKDSVICSGNNNIIL